MDTDLQHRIKERDKRLSQLLQLKRLEHPDAVFWKAFEQALRNRQLSTLVRVQPWYERFGRICLLLAKKTGPATAAASVLAITLVVVTNSTQLASHDEPASESAIVESPAPLPEPVFVVESVEAETAPNEEVVETLLRIEGPAIYQVRSLVQPSQNTPYRLNTSPVIFSPNVGGNTSESNRMGAKVIKTDSQF